MLTARHHDGVALWGTRVGDLSVVRRTPAARDLVTPFVAALRAPGIRPGLYYSHSDWSHSDYATVRHPAPAAARVNDNRLSAPEPGAEDPAGWERYLGYRQAQIRELIEIGPDLLWFDGDWERSERQWHMRKLRADILERRPDIVINGRMLGYGDYVTPEQAAPVTAPDGPWELCLTLNDSWGYRPADQNFKSVRQLVRYFTETIGMGGNLLLGIGPTQDGVVPPESAARLEELGRWISRHAEAVYPTGRGLPAGHCYGPSAISADRTVLYLFCLDPPREFVAVRGIKTPVRSVSVLGTGAKLAHRVVGGLHEIPGVLHIAAPQEADIDEYATVLAVELESELELSRDRVRDWTRTPAGRRRLNIASRWSLPGLA